jgi:hypothetical protein
LEDGKEREERMERKEDGDAKRGWRMEEKRGEEGCWSAWKRGGKGAGMEEEEEEEERIEERMEEKRRRGI